MVTSSKRHGSNHSLGITIPSADATSSKLSTPRESFEPINALTVEPTGSPVIVKLSPGPNVRSAIRSFSLNAASSTTLADGLRSIVTSGATCNVIRPDNGWPSTLTWYLK